MSYHILNLKTGEHRNATGYAAAQRTARKIAVTDKVAVVVYERETDLHAGTDWAAFDDVGNVYVRATDIAYARPDCPGLEQLHKYRRLGGHILIDVDW